MLVSLGTAPCVTVDTYHTEFPWQVLGKGQSICDLEALNAHLPSRKVILHSDSATMVAIFLTGRGKVSYIQACANEIWLPCTIDDITLTFSHTPGEQLVDTPDALSHVHKSGVITTGCMSS